MERKAFRFIFSLLLTALSFVAFNVVGTVYDEFTRPAFVQTEQFTITESPSFFFAYTRLFIGAILLICTFIFWWSSKKSLIVSILMLVIVELIYVHWLFKTYNGIHNAAALDYSKIEHIAFLGNANWLDILIWITCSITLCYLFKALLQIRTGKQANISLP